MQQCAEGRTIPTAHYGAAPAWGNDPKRSRVSKRKNYSPRNRDDKDGLGCARTSNPDRFGSGGRNRVPHGRFETTSFPFCSLRDGTILGRLCWAESVRGC